jgi:hypothetical protein
MIASEVPPGTWKLRSSRMRLAPKRTERWLTSTTLST